MSRGTVVVGTCPQCKDVVPLIWDGTCRPHATTKVEPGWAGDCPGSLHAPLDRVTFEETNQ